MAKMRERDLIAFLDAADSDAASYAQTLELLNAEMVSAYHTEPQGDEESDKSQFVSTDVFDLVESDMPSLVRVFLGADDILVFHPIGEGKEDKAEADQKTKYVNYLVRKQPESFATIHGWLKDAELHKTGVVKFYHEERKTTDERKIKGMSGDELTVYVNDLQSARDVDSVEIVAREEADEGKDEYTVTVRITKKKKRIVIRGVPPESFRISRNATSKDEAVVVGDDVRKTRGQLIAEGYDREVVKSLPKLNQDATALPRMRFGSQGSTDDFESHWANELVEIRDRYVLLDYDGDGIAERRHIVRSGDKILENEPFGIVPYALLSSILMPHAAIGRSRAEIALPTKKLKTQLIRQINNNIFSVNNPRTVVNDRNVELDDLLVHKFNGIVRTNGVPSQDVMPLVTPYIGTQALEIIQYYDAMRAQSTGSLMASQGLEVSNLTKETATRFEGVRDVSEAKIELMARVYAETGFRELFDGLVWLAMHYQDSDTEIMVLGRPLTINPSRWRYDHYASATVGLAAGDSEELLKNAGTLYQIQEALRARGSQLVDEQKVYNSLNKITKTMGVSNVNDYFNDPSKPQELLLAQLEQMSLLIVQMEQQLQASSTNPLAEAEMIRARAEMLKQQTSKEIKAAEIEQANKEFMANMAAKLTELELKYGANVPGAIV